MESFLHLIKIFTVENRLVFRMDINDFHLEKSIFEYRYPPSYLHWDRVGTMWSEAVRKWPHLRNSRGEPNITTFILDDAYELAVTLDKASVVGYHPKPDLADVTEKITYFLEATRKHLQIEQYTRIGLRLQYFRTFPTLEAASIAMLGAKVLQLSEGPHFGLDGSFSLPEYAVRWESRTAGVTVRIRTEGRKVDFDPPLGIRELKAVHEEKSGIVLDIDYFTKGQLTVGQFSAKDWIANVLHVIRRDSRKFLRT